MFINIVLLVFYRRCVICHETSCHHFLMRSFAYSAALYKSITIVIFPQSSTIVIFPQVLVYERCAVFVPDMLCSITLVICLDFLQQFYKLDVLNFGDFNKILKLIFINIFLYKFCLFIILILKLYIALSGVLKLLDFF